MKAGNETPYPEACERFPIATTKDRWLECAALEHETLPMPVDFEREGDQLVVRRDAAPGRTIAAGRVPGDLGPALFLQAAAAVAFWNGNGIWLDAEDLLEARWDARGRVPRLTLTRSPAGVRGAGPGPAPAAVLAVFVERLFRRRGAIASGPAGTLLDRLRSSDAGSRRPEFWLSTAYRLFPDVGEPRMAAARLRTIGYGGSFLRDPGRRALVAKAQAVLAGRAARVFAVSAPLVGGAALGFEEAPRGAVQAARWLRERHERESTGRSAVWIAVGRELWDVLSRTAFETACRALEGEVERVDIAMEMPPPRLPDEWRREISVPCGALGASIRFYEELSERAREAPARALGIVREAVASKEWAAFAGDATGDAALPFAERDQGPEFGLSPSPASRDEKAVLALLTAADRPLEARLICRALPTVRPLRSLQSLAARGDVLGDQRGRWSLTGGGRETARTAAAAVAPGTLARLADFETDPARKVDLLLRCGDAAAALAQAERWIESHPGSSPESWFELSARLAQAAGSRLPGWLALLEAERDIAGGHPAEAEDRLDGVARDTSASAAHRRLAALRCAEVQIALGRMRRALEISAAWRREFPSAPPAEKTRALRVEAACRAREGGHEAALRLLDHADRAAVTLPLAERLENALTRAAVYSLQGRFEEEQRLYESWKPVVSRAGEDALTARLLAREALGLCDRREFAAAAARLEQARDVLRDDLVERARVSIDLAATFYHAGRPARCDTLLQEAISCAGLAGREDLARIARANRLELLIGRRDWNSARVEAEVLASAARREGDDVRLLVALHQASRLALRLGHLERASRENAQARALAQRLNDRLEIGELWLEEGDRLVYESRLAEARAAYERAAADPPDRCDTDCRARERLAEMAAPHPEAEGSAAALEETFARDEYAAAESLARRHAILSANGGGLSAAWRARAERVLRTCGGEALADHVFGRADQVPVSVSRDALRGLRLAVACALAGEEGDTPSLAPLGLVGLRILNSEGRELARLGPSGRGPAEGARRRLEAGSAAYELEVWPPPPPEAAESVAWLLETLLFRVAPAPEPSDHSRGWRRFGIVAADVSMEEPYRRLCLFAAQPVTVLVLGESGTGKEAVARAVHVLSPRASRPFVAVNVAAIPQPLLESELFGHARGAFTGADRERRGLVEEADGGTIFFDEIGDLDMLLQAKLLRALQEREIRRVGESRARPVDVRVVSATARDLGREVNTGHFREDLFYRLHVAVIPLPPLRRRGKDVFLLARHFLERYACEYARGSLRFAPEALSAIAAHAWPGNVRELQNAVSQAAALAEPEGVVTMGLLPETVRRARNPSSSPVDYRSQVDAHRRDLICEALERTGGNRSRAARDLGLSRQALLYLIRELKINAPRRAAR